MPNERKRKMKFQLSFTCDNAAFDDDNRDTEISRLLRDIAQKIEGGAIAELPGKFRSILDVNGNKVGEWRLQ